MCDADREYFSFFPSWRIGTAYWILINEYRHNYKKLNEKTRKIENEKDFQY
jgi:hypothetical protein